MSARTGKLGELIRSTRPANWRRLKTPAWGSSETWFARYRGWSLYAKCSKLDGRWVVSLHQFTRDGGARQPQCRVVHATLGAAQHVAEYYAEQGKWP